MENLYTVYMDMVMICRTLILPSNVSADNRNDDRMGKCRLLAEERESNTTGSNDINSDLVIFIVGIIKN